MKVIDESGNYKLKPLTRTPESSEHPVHQARIEMALGKGAWLFAPNRGHQLKKFQNMDQTQGNQESFQKELLLYLEKYSPEVSETFVGRSLVDMNLTIDKDALDV